MPNNEFMKQIFRAQDESNQDPKLFKELVMKYTGLTPRGFKNEMSGPVGKTTLLKGKPARDYYIKSDSKLSESEILFLKKWAGTLTEEDAVAMSKTIDESMSISHMNSGEMLDKLRSFGDGYARAADMIEEFLQKPRALEYDDFKELHNAVWPILNAEVRKDQAEGNRDFGKRYTFVNNIMSRLADRPDNSHSNL